MSRARLAVASAAIAAGVLGLGSPVEARGVPDSPPSTTSTTTTTTVPGGIDVAHGGDVDGARAPGEEVRVEPVDAETASEVLRLSTEDAQARRAEVQAQLDDVLEHIDRLEADLRAYGQLTDDLVVQQRDLTLEAVATRLRLRHQAVGAYVHGNQPAAEAAYGAVNPSEAEERTTMIAAVVDADQDHASELLARRLAVTATLSRVLEQSAQAEAEVRVARGQADDLRVRVQSAEVALRVAQEGGDLVVTGFVFPVADPHTFSSTFGAPRVGHSHQGNDIFAPMGTPLLATERGVLTNIGTGTLGGIKLWLVGESGTQYYYAHLSAYADGIYDGMPVEAGQVIGYVGNTGNAISTPPHCHFEIHPDGGDAIDPYPLLHAVDQVDGEHVLPPRRV